MGEGTSYRRADAACGQAQQCHSSLLSRGVQIGRMSPRIKFVVLYVELPVCWKYGCRGENCRAYTSDILDTGKRGAGV